MKAEYSIVKIDNELNYVLIRDQNGAMSITNDAENVVEHLTKVLTRKLSLSLDDLPTHKIYYIDSTGVIDKIDTNEFYNFDGFTICNYPNQEFLEKALRIIGDHDD